ncbi:MAG: hypothetical protein ACJAUP_000530 [Cellvibrionaceae bacterium]|jgi:hypothetical protein
MTITTFLKDIGYRAANILNALGIFCFFITTFSFINVANAAEYVSEPKLNLIYTINIAKFVKWKPPHKEINICISENSKIYKYARNIGSVAIDKNRSIQIKINPKDFFQCQIIYWDDSSTPILLPTEIKKYSLKTLFITDSRTLSKNGFDIQFFIRNLKVRFYINDNTADKRYKISSKLLRLSKNLN